MWIKFKQFVSPPKYQDEEKALVTSLLNSVILIFVVFTVLINIILPFINPSANYITSLGLMIIAIVLFVLIRYGGYRAVQLSSIVFCLALWIIVTLNGWSDEGLRNMASGVYFMLTIVAGLLLGGEGAIYFGLLSIAGASIIYFGEIQGAISFAPRGVSLPDLIKFILVEITVMFLVRFAVKRLMAALNKLRINERMLAERAEELGTANRQLRKLAQAKDEFIANVSHELRSPITSLHMYEDLLGRRPDRIDQYMPIIRRETARLGGLIDDLLNISQLQQDGVELRLERFDLNALVKEYVNDRRPIAESRGLSLTYEEKMRLPSILGDRNLLGQSISILLTNSMNYTPSGGRVYISTDTRFLDGHNWVGFIIHDTGPGITVEDQEHLFSRFYRGRIGRNSGHPGTGLGLAIAKEIIERHKGSIEVRSKGLPGKGATFYIWLPSDETDFQEASKEDTSGT
jgi:signal transduction histidine kinase